MRIVAAALIVVAAGCGGTAAPHRARRSGRCPTLVVALPSSDAATNDWPRWSPDSRRLVFGSSRTGNDVVYVLDVAHCRTSRVARGFRPSFAPDGKHVVFERDVDAHISIFTSATDGTDQHRVTGGAFDDEEPSWSPDGKWIAFTRSASSEESGFNVFFVGPGGGRLHALPARGSTGSPAWSPDGKRLAFTCGQNGDICAARADGKALRKIARFASTGALGLSWSRDAKTIAFTGNGPQGNVAAFVAGVATGQKRILLSRPNEGGVDYPAFSPDGRWVALSIDSGQNTSDLFLVRPDGSGLRRLTRTLP
jgi:Tol biopolymer transport system component